MNRHSATLTLALATLLCVTVSAQTNSNPRLIELSGTFSFKSSTTEDYVPGTEWYRQIFKSNIITFHPILGYEVLPRFQAALEFGYEYQWTSIDVASYNSGTPDVGPLRSYIYRPSMGLILSYDIPISEFLVPFVAARGAYSWRIVTQKQGTDPSYTSRWSLPSVSFPSVVVGSRYFISESWAILVRLTFEARNNEYGRPETKVQSYALDYGIAARF